MKKIVLVTGGFDPLHSGHIAYLEAAKRLGNQLVVGLNSDAWLARKKGRAFMPWDERVAIVKNLKMVDYVLEFNDDNNTAINAIEKTKIKFSDATIIFANGGDRTQDNIPEMQVEGVTFAFGTGGTDKANSSSWILEEWKAPKTERPWGYYRILHEVPGTKVKELTVLPGQKLSMQRHHDRAEHWHIVEGVATVYTINRKSDQELLGEFTTHQHIHINRYEWHQLCNETNQPLRVVEIQYGVNCVEEDIERQ
jgi:cytidyltransferase-like protein